MWSDALEPLVRIAAARFAEWLPRLSHPARTGEHGQTAFALALVLDWSRARPDAAIRRLVERRTQEFYGGDAGWPLAFEPSGHDFLSPSLAEADLMRRVLDPAAFADWLDRFLPELRLAALTREGYMSTHWLGSFAVYLITRRGR